MSSHADQVGHYTIEREIGRGGMGVVYLARDNRLGRNVAIKALPESLSQDPERLARFEREARTMASLNHTNVASIYGVEEHEGRVHLVLEYVEGETLAARLARAPMSMDEAIEICMQITRALEAAHEQGVVHRDLKPGNVMLTQEGHVKVLDFGLAKSAGGFGAAASGAAGPSGSLSPTLQTPIHSPTIPGVILGTAGYMSPEQARGRFVDKRSDIFSFGCVLFEMFTGRSPFAGESATDTIGAVLHCEPEWSSLPPDTPPILRLLLRRCLAKDRDKRLHDIADARLDLEQAMEDPSLSSIGLASAPMSGPAARRGGRTALTAAALLICIAIASAFAFQLGSTRRPAPSAGTTKPIHFTIPARTAAYQVAAYQMEEGCAISPDGRLVLFAASGADDGVRRVWIRPIGADEARPLTDTVGAMQPFWSGDNRSIGFHADGRLWAIDIDGGARRLLASIAESEGAAWSSDGDILVGRLGLGLTHLSASGGRTRVITTPDRDNFENSHVLPHFLPDGRRFFFIGMTFNPDEEVPTRRLYAGSLDSEETTIVGEYNSCVWYAEPGFIVYVDEGSVRAAPFDVDTLRTTGPPRTLADSVAYFRPTAASSLSVARDGAMVFIPPLGGQRLAWHDARGDKLDDVGPVGAFHAPIRISPDGEQVAAALIDPRTALTDIWLYGLTRTTSMRLTSDARWEGQPTWSPDGSTIYFAWDRDGPPDIFSISASGAGEIKSVHRSDQAAFPVDVSPDGRSLLYMHLTPGGLRVVSLDGEAGADSREFRESNAREGFGRYSPDGRWLASVSLETGRAQIYLDPVGRPGRRVQVSTDGGIYPVWSPDGARLYYRRQSAGGRYVGTQMMVVDLADPRDYERPEPRLLFESRQMFEEFDIHPDGARFLLKTVPDEPPPIHVILNWMHL